MVVSTTLHVEQGALVRYDRHTFAGKRSSSSYASVDSQKMSTVAANLPTVVPSVSVSAIRPGVEASVLVSGIRDRVTISSEAYAGTAVRHITYDKNGNLSPVIPPRVSTGATAYAETIRDQVTLVLKPPPGAVRRGIGSQPAQLLVWFSPTVLPESA